MPHSYSNHSWQSVSDLYIMADFDTLNPHRPNSITLTAKWMLNLCKAAKTESRYKFLWRSDENGILPHSYSYHSWQSVSDLYIMADFDSLNHHRPKTKILTAKWIIISFKWANIEFSYKFW